MIDKTQRLNESLDSFLTEYKEKNEGNKYRPVAVGRYGIRTRESIYSKELAKDYSKNKLIFKNTLTVGMGSTQIDIGVLSEDATYAVSPAYHTYRIHDINSDYLRYCLECRNQDMFVRYVKRGSRQGKSIDLKRWITYKIPVYPESVQAEIVKRLDSVKAILSLREQELNALDDLIKARFVELFGNPLDGTAKYPIHQVGEVANSVDPQPSHRTPSIDEDGIPYVSTKDCDYKTGKIDFEGARKVSRGVLEEHLNRYTLHDGDFIIGKIGTIGKPVFVPARENYTLSANVVLVQPNSDLVSPYFLKYSFESDFVERQFAEAKNSTSQAAFGIQKVRTVKVMNPNLNIQRGFEDFVKQIDKSKLLSGCRLFHFWAPENRDKPKHVGVPQRRTKDLRECRRQQ